MQFLYMQKQTEGTCSLKTFKRNALSMFDVQAAKWTQVAPKSSQDTPKMAPTWPKIAKVNTSRPQVFQDSPKMAPICPRIPTQAVTRCLLFTCYEHAMACNTQPIAPESARRNVR